MTASADLTSPTVRQRVGGRWAVSRTGWLLTLPFALVGTTFAHAGQVSGPRTLALWVMTGVLAWAALGVVLLAAHLTVLRHRAIRPVPLALVVAVGAVVGTVRSLTVGLAAEGLGLVNPTPWPMRAFGGAILGCVWIPLMAATLDAHDRYRRARDELITTRLAERVQALGTVEQTEALRRDLLAGIEENLTEATADLRTRIQRLRNAEFSSDDDLETLASDLSLTATDAVRPLGRQLWSAAQANIPRLRIGEIIRTTMTAASLRPWAATAIGILAGLTGISANESLLVAAQSVLPTSGLVLVWLLGVETLRRRTMRLASALYAVGILGTAVLSLMLAPLLQEAGVSRATSLGWAAMGALIFTPTVIMLGVAEVVAKKRLHVLGTLQEQLHGTRLHRIAIEEQATAVRRELGEFLHGTVQSQLMAASLAVANAQRTGDRALLERGLDSAVAALNIRQAHVGADTGDLLGGIRAVAASWQGLVNIDLHISDGSDTAVTPVLAQLATSVVREAVANAVRHGHAHSVRVLVREDTESLIVTVENDGSSPSRLRPGLGSTLLDRIAPGGWSLEPRDGGGAILTVHLALNQQ